MEETKRKINWKIVAMVVMALLLVFSLAKINELENQISNLDNTIANCNHQISNMQSNIDSIYNNVDEQLKKEASLLTSVDYTLGDLNTENHTVAVTVKLTPKNLAEDMQLTMNLDGQTVTFERNGNEFFATFSVNMFIDCDNFPMLNIVAGGTTQTELLESVDLTDLYTRVLPNIFAHITPFSQFTKGKLTIDSDLNFDVKPANSHSEITIKKVELVTEKNDKEIAHEDLTNVFTTDNSHITVKETYDVGYGDKLCIYVLAEDSLGYTHKILAYYWHEIDGHISESVTVIEDGVMIYDKNGNLLNGGNE